VEDWKVLWTADAENQFIVRACLLSGALAGSGCTLMALALLGLLVA
jgi:hypothetical protein